MARHNASRLVPRSTVKADGPHQRLRLGLCCQFAEQPIHFRTTTANSLLKLPRPEQLRKLSQLCLGNAGALLQALQYCAGHGIGCFRIVSTILPVRTHPQAGYQVAELPDAEAIVAAFRHCGRYAQEQGIRTTFHPDQFVVLNSPREDVVRKSLEDLQYHSEVAAWTAADVINIHAGGAYGDKPAALRVLARQLEQLPDDVRSRLTLENDDTTFTPADLLPLCRSLSIPLVYDAHHHRCLSDGLSVQDATEAALATWQREPLFHISSPLAGWSGARPQRHHDYIDPADFPDCWRPLRLTIEVEAKAKELAVERLSRQLFGGDIGRSAESAAAGSGGDPASTETRSR